MSSYLIHATGDKAMPGVWLTFAAVCGLLGTLLIKRLVQQYQTRQTSEPVAQM
jgi:cytoskeletal protein RodZ